MVLRVLIIGDTHIPTRARKIPYPIIELIESRKFDYVLSTGDFVNEETRDYLAGLGSKFYAVKGNMDFLDLPGSVKFYLEGLAVGLIHGDGIWPRGDMKQLLAKASIMGVDVLVSGHTHAMSVRLGEIEGRKILLLDPGSATGVWGGGPQASLIPSFITAKVDGRKLELECYELVKGELKRKAMEVQL